MIYLIRKKNHRRFLFLRHLYLWQPMSLCHTIAIWLTTTICSFVSWGTLAFLLVYIVNSSIITFVTGSLFLPIQWDITVRCTPLSCCLSSWTAHMSLSFLSRITTCASPIHPRVVSAKRMTNALDVRDECYQH